MADELSTTYASWLAELKERVPRQATVHQLREWVRLAAPDPDQLGVIHDPV